MYHSTMKGSDNMAFPDLCKTPTPVGPIPLPYPNMSSTQTGIPPALIVLIECMPAQNILSIIPLSSGDEPGAAGGLISNIFKGPTFTIGGSGVLMTGGLPATKLNSATIQNLINMVGLTISPSQTKVDVLG
jgi:hypothetical protein